MRQVTARAMRADAMRFELIPFRRLGGEKVVECVVEQDRRADPSEHSDATAAADGNYDRWEGRAIVAGPVHGPPQDIESIPLAAAKRTASDSRRVTALHHSGRVGAAWHRDEIRRRS